MVQRDSLADPGACLLSFSLGPVQPFIASARSLRDLWTGSYLLSWLTSEAMRPILALGEEAFVTPAVIGNPFFERAGQSGNDRLPAACLPNRFLAVVPKESNGETARDLALKCEQRCRVAWKRVCDAVRTGLDSELGARGLNPEWDRLWDDQVRGFFEVHTAVLPFEECDEAILRTLLGTTFDATRREKLWWGRLQLAARLMEAIRSAGHDPDYRAQGDVPQKCTLLGSYEQMGPALFERSREFWEKLAKLDWKGTQTRKAERLCAVSLVKRFAWPAFLSQELGLLPSAGYYPDTATIAAARWLREGPSTIKPIQERRQGEPWSGQWLHWPQREGPRRRNTEGPTDVDRPPSPELWARIQEKRKQQEPPPAYLAIVMLDGDHLGRWLRGDQTPQAGPELNRAIGSALAHFALTIAPEVVTKHEGTLVYAGGDDVLAFLPTRAALACAFELNARFAANWVERVGYADDGSGATTSAGLAVVHHKEDLRFALSQARRAEKAAKLAGRDALTLAICRRSGEHSSVVMPWSLVEHVETWVEKFGGAASDRWLYTLRAELPTLQGEELPWEAVRAEVRRLAARAEDESKRIDPQDAVMMLDRYRDAWDARKTKPTDASILGDFITLGQSASFLARGRD